MKAVSAFSAALFLLRVEPCKKSGMVEPCMTQLSPHHSQGSTSLPLSRSDSSGDTSLQQEMLAMLSKLSFTGHDGPFELSGTRRHLTRDGRLVANKYSVARISPDGEVIGVSFASCFRLILHECFCNLRADTLLYLPSDMICGASFQIGWYSDDKGLQIDSLTQRAANAQRKSTSSDRKQPRGFSSDYNHPSLRNEPQLDSLTVVGEGVDAKKVGPDNYLGRLWATIMVAIAAMGFMISLFILVYVLIKICDGTLSGNQSLGVILLLGIMTLFACVVPFVLPLSETKCGVRVMIYPVALALCYGILLVKVMQLRSLVLLGLGGRISYLNQYIILFFIVLVQASIYSSIVLIAVLSFLLVSITKCVPRSSCA